MVLFGAACRTYIDIECSCCVVLRAQEFHACESQRRKKKLKIIDFIGFCGLWKLVLLVLESIFFSFNQLWWHMAVTGLFHFSTLFHATNPPFQLQKPFTFQSVVGWNKCKYTHLKWIRFLLPSAVKMKLLHRKRRKKKKEKQKLKAMKCHSSCRLSLYLLRLRLMSSKRFYNCFSQ